MRSSPRRPSWLLLAGLSLSTACGGPPPPPTAAPRGASSSPGEACLSIAGARREVRPGQPARIGVKQLLVRHAGADRAEGVTRTREAACLRAMEARDKLRGGADLAEVVKEYSEEAGAASREGSLGIIERGDVLPSFADAAFELDLNQLSDVVETRYGFHVIFRTE
jgi:peptidyl-prolyl cis-trans isomerase NIMA-interacting 1